MPHTYTNFIYHVVFAAKERFPLITNELKPRLYDYLGGTIRGLDGILLEIGGTNDHVHILIKLKPIIKFSDFMRELKAKFIGLGEQDHSRAFRMAERLRSIYGSRTADRKRSPLYSKSGSASRAN
jgi:REP element-mobilizing transposase RayT